MNFFNRIQIGKDLKNIVVIAYLKFYQLTPASMIDYGIKAEEMTR